MEEQFIPFELAVKLKELGFKEKCIAKYNNESKILYILHPHESFYEFTEVSEFNDFLSDEVNNTITIVPLWQQAFDWCFNQIKNNSNLSNRNYWLIQKHEFFEVVSNLSHSSEESLMHGTKEDCLIKLIELCQQK